MKAYCRSNWPAPTQTDVWRPLPLAFLALALGAVAYRIRPQLPSFLRGGASDFLWAFAFACTLLAVTKFSRAWAFAGLGISLGLELIQVFPGVPGTFDSYDLLAIGLGYGAGLLGGLAIAGRGNGAFAQIYKFHKRPQ